MEYKMIYLIGFMGSGKTTVGAALREQIAANVVDTDQWIEKREGRTVKEIFAEKGEAYFRNLETEALKEIKDNHLIVTTGGGIVSRKENRDLMKDSGKVIYLECQIEELLRRLKDDASRPLLQDQDQEKIVELFYSRKVFYEEADLTIDTTKKGIEEIVSIIDKWLKKF
ncbi:shikimate kinase [Bacillus sp. JCM 19034]|uniref:shikimate kinase n=1 Tax=Bacillus sp. JCM 19034 TaxID=1481928 RepID=UPI000AC40C17